MNKPRKPVEPLLSWEDKTFDSLGKPRNSRSVQALDSVFRLRRHLARLLKDTILGGSGFSLEDGDLLLALFGARLFGWRDPNADADGFVSLSDLKRSPMDAGLLTRRIAELEGGGYVELTKARRGASKRVRISDQGIKVFHAFYELYSRLADRVLDGLSDEEIERFWKVNEFLIKRIQWRA